MADKAPTFETEKNDKSERLEARLSPAQKRLFLLAATLEGQSLTDFMLVTLQREAERTVERHQIMKLSVEQTQAFAQAILNPRKPSSTLRKYAEKDRKLFGE